jgi:pimeloyl-ACP methyl ester carboxylesterase
VSATVPFFFDTGFEPAFGLLSLPAAGARRRVPVLLCPPWGWDEVASYRSRRRWAQALADAGHPTLRFSYPGTGDSGGDPADPSRVDAWVAAVAAGAANLRDSQASEVAVLGLGLGGLLAREAVARGAQVDELVLWGAPGSGRAFAREAMAFSNMQEWAGTDTGLEEGWLEAGGFLLSPETDKELRKLSPAVPEGSPLRRALLLDRDGAEVDAKSREGLEGGGVEVSTAPGQGWGDLVSHPERSRLPLEVVGAVQSWLEQGEKGNAAASSPGGPAIPAWGSSDLRLRVAGTEVVEAPLTVEQAFGRAFGVLTTPAAKGQGELCAVFLNAGAVRHTGPNRMWVETARRWAARGVNCLRVDLEAIGEADGDESRLRSVPEFYTDRYEAQVSRVLDALQARGLGNRFLLVGLCAGGFWSFRAALADRRIERAVLLNAGALIWHDNILSEREVRKISQVRQWSRWKKLLSGGVERERLRRFARSLFQRSSWKRRGRGGDGFVADLDRLREAGVRVTLAFAENEPLAAELEREGVIAQLRRWPGVTVRELPGSDHTLRPPAAQRAARELLDEELGRALGPGPGRL